MYESFIDTEVFTKSFKRKTIDQVTEIIIGVSEAFAPTLPPAFLTSLLPPLRRLCQMEAVTPLRLFQLRFQG